MNWIQKKRVDFLYNRARTYFEKEDYQNAIDNFFSVKEIAPEWAEPYANIGVCYHKLGHHQKAISFLDQAIALFPSEKQYVYNKMVILQIDGYHQASYDTSVKLLQMNPADMEVIKFQAFLCFLLGDHAEAIDIHTSLLNGDEDIHHYTCIAENYSKQGNIKKCIAFYERVLMQDPSNPSALNNIGYNRLKLEHYKKAIIDFDNAIRVNDQMAFPYNNRGFAYLKLAQFEKAIADIDHSISLDDQNSYAYKNKALYFIAMDEVSKALECLKKAQKLGFQKLYGDEVEKLIAELGGV